MVRNIRVNNNINNSNSNKNGIKYWFIIFVDRIIDWIMFVCCLVNKIIVNCVIR